MSSFVSVTLRNTSGKAEFDVPEATLRLPLSSSPQNLNDLVHHLLDRQDVLFRFFIHGSLLQGQLEQLLTAKGITTEAQFTVEFSPVTQLPEDHQEQRCPDWIRSVKATTTTPQACILTGSFDCAARLHDQTGIIREYHGHKACVTALEWILPGEKFVSGSNDWTLRIWSAGKERAEAILKGHGAAVQCLSYNVEGEKIISGHFDGKLAIWSSDSSKASLESTPPARKKGKKSSPSPAIVEDAPVMGPDAILSGHKDGAVTGLVVNRHHGGGTFWSVGLDKRLIQWDLGRLEKDSTWTLPSQVSCMAASSLDHRSLAMASPDGHVRLFDTSSMKPTSSAKVHEGWISAMAWSPTDPNHFVTAAADCKVCIWDRRALGEPLKLLETRKKVLALDWTSSGLYFGGEDCILHTYT